jgi:hypothetical protein
MTDTLTPRRFWNLAKKNAVAYANFEKFFSFMLDGWDFATTDPKRRSVENPKGMVRNSLDRIHATLADLVFVGRVNRKARELGLSLTYSMKTARELCRLRFFEHCTGGDDETLYICSRHDARHRGGRPYLFVIDLDNHDGNGSDLFEAAFRINESLGFGLYWEPSTSGSGLHGWAVVVWNGSATEYRSWTASVKYRLASFLEENQFGATADICGMPPEGGGYGLMRSYDSGGLLIKAPKLRTPEQFETFFTTLRFCDPSVFDEMLGFEPTLPSLSPLDSLLSTGELSSFNREGDFEIVAEADSTGWNYLDHSNGKTTESAKVNELLTSGNPFVSRYGAILASLQREGAKSTPASATSIYEAEGAATGQRTRERERWFLKRHPRFLKAYDPDRRGSSDPTWFNSSDKDEVAAELLPLLVAKGYSVARNQGKPYVNLDDLSVLACLVRASMARVGFCCYAGLKAFFALAGHSLSNEKISRYLKVLVEVGKLRVVSKPRLRSKDDEGVVTLGQSGRYEWLAPKLASSVGTPTPMEVSRDGVPPRETVLGWPLAGCSDSSRDGSKDNRYGRLETDHLEEEAKGLLVDWTEGNSKEWSKDNRYGRFENDLEDVTT